MAKTFRNSAAFGKRIEYWVVGQMLKEGLDVYLPLVDDDGVDGVIRRADGSFTSFQVKARSREVKLGDAALFAAIWHELRDNYWFIFYSERLDTMWIMTSQEFIKNAVTNKTGKHIGIRSIWFNGTRRDLATKEPTEYVKDQWKKFVARDFSRIRNISCGEIHPGQNP